MSARQRFALLILSGLSALSMQCVYGQDYPAKLIRIITSEPGGGLDIAARLLAPGLTARLGRQVIVDNRGRLASEVATKVPPDGYTILLNASPHWLMPYMRDSVSWDPVNGFLPVTWIASSPNILVVHPSLPSKTVREFIALARARPGEINYSSGGVGGSSHLAGALFAALAKINIVHIPYKGTGPGINDLVGGDVQLMFPNVVSVAQHVKSGRLRALAVTSARPSLLAPDLPTVAASGVPGYESEARFAMFVVAGTPAGIVSRLNREIVAELRAPEIKERLLATGTVVVGSSESELDAMMKSEMTRLGKVIRDAGIRSD
jgi:tripartite-type tricarboxylate transporter receptor subunit TctC